MGISCVLIHARVGCFLKPNGLCTVSIYLLTEAVFCGGRFSKLVFWIGSSFLYFCTPILKLFLPQVFIAKNKFWMGCYCPSEYKCSIEIIRFSIE